MIGTAAAPPVTSAPSAPLVTNRFFMRHLGFNPDTEFAPISAAAEGQMCRVVSRSLSVTNLVGGQLPAAVRSSVAPVLSARHRVRILALTTNERYPSEPDLATPRETVPGVVTGLAAMTASVAPAGTPSAARPLEPGGAHRLR